MSLTFELLHTDAHSQARLGRLQTPHGTFDTPVFMPIGTQATVKTLRTSDLQACGAAYLVRLSKLSPRITRLYYTHLASGPGRLLAGDAARPALGLLASRATTAQGLTCK